MQPIDILLVEDNEGDVLLTTEALQEQNFINEIFVVNNGMEALDYLLRKVPYKDSPTPDLVLLDINLPKLNGQEVLKQIRSNSLIRNIPVVMLSTSSSSEDVTESLKNGANCYLTKPVDIDLFLKEISLIKELGISHKKVLNS